ADRILPCPAQVCPNSQVFNTVSCRCESAETGRDCSTQPCQQNQVGRRDCNGRCYCACKEGYVGIKCEIRLQPDLCSNCSFDNGHYHTGLSGHCDMFVVCIPVRGKKQAAAGPLFVPRIMSCPPGTYYVTRPSGWKGCDHPENGRCSSDRCETSPPNGRYADPTACQSYWQCGPDRRLSSKGCCPAGHRFEPSSSQCVPDSSCPVTCGGNRTHACAGEHSQFVTGCPYDVSLANPNEFFYKFMPGSSFRCQPMEVMDVGECRCVRDQRLSPSDCKATVSLDFEDVPMNDEDRVPRVSTGNGHAANFR
ncbi:unnamed protein product, partial [Candidula unifasciata]